MINGSIPMLTLLQPTSSHDCDSDGEAAKSTKRRISFTPDLSEGNRKKSGPYSLVPRALWLQICSKQYQREHLFHVEYISVIPLTAGDCFSTGENKVVVQEMGRERESSSFLKRSSEVLGPSSPSAAVLDSDLAIRVNLERRPSLEGNFIYS